MSERLELTGGRHAEGKRGAALDRFDAFISYSHAADGRLAPAVHAGLQRFAKGVFARRALRVFHDQTGLSVNPHLWNSIETALLQAEWFVLLASPESAASHWVDREVASWLEHKSIDHLLVVVTDGRLAFGRDDGVDPERTDCLPPSLVEALDTEPLWLDLRWARDETQLDLRNVRFRAAIADLAAPIHGLPKDELASEDVRQQKRARRLAIGGVTAIGLLAIASIVTAVVAFDQRREAAAQRDEAELQREDAITQRNEAELQRERADEAANVATSRGLAAQAAALSDTSIDLSLLLAVEAYQRDASVETETGLLTALESGRLLTSLSPGLPSDVADLASSRDHSTLYVLTDGGEIMQYEASSFEPIGDPLVTGVVEPLGLDVSLDGTRLAFSGGEGAGVIDLSSGELLADGLGAGTSVPALSADGSLLALGLRDEEFVRVFDVGDGSLLHEIAAYRGAVAFLSNTRLAVQPQGSQFLTVYTLGDGAVSVEMEKYTVAAGNVLAVNGTAEVEGAAEGGRLVVGGQQGLSVLLDATTLEFVGPVIRTRGSNIVDISFSADNGLAVLSTDDGSATVVATFEGFERATLAGLTGSLATEFVGPPREFGASIVSAPVGGGRAATWEVGGRSAVGEAHFTGLIDLRMFGSDTMVSWGFNKLTVAASDQIAAPDVQREFGDNASRSYSQINTLAIAEERGLIAVDVHEYGEESLRTDRRIHILNASDLKDVTVIPIGEIALDGETSLDPSFSTGDTVLSFAPDGRRLAAGLGNGQLVVFDVDTGDVLFEPIEVDEFPCCLGTLVWSPDGTRLHTGGQEGVLRTFDTSSWRQVGEHRLTSAAALQLSQLTPDGTMIIVPTESGQVFLVDAMTGEPKGDPFEAAGTQLQRALLSRDGAMLAAQSRDGKLRLWDVETLRPVGPALNGHSTAISRSLEPLGGDVVISGGADGFAIEWSLDAESWVARACELAGRNLSNVEWSRYIGGEPHITCDQWPSGS